MPWFDKILSYIIKGFSVHSHICVKPHVPTAPEIKKANLIPAPPQVVASAMETLTLLKLLKNRCQCCVASLIFWPGFICSSATTHSAGVHAESERVSEVSSRD